MAHQNAGVLGMFNRIRSDFAAKRARQARIRQTINELDALSTQELNDLGIGRHDIPRIARETP